MSKLFSDFQQILRNFKDEHGIDINNPNGSIVYTKRYPAIKKHVWMYINHPTGPFSQVDFHIPLENGHNVHVVKMNDGETEAHVYIPTRYVSEIDPTKVSAHQGYFHRPMLNSDGSYSVPKHLQKHMTGVEPNKIIKNNETFNDYVQSVSRLPRFGTTASKGKQREMTDDELNEHFQNTRRPQERDYPHNIRLNIDDSISKRIYVYNYDINTEKLTTEDDEISTYE